MCRWIAYNGQPIFIEQLVTLPTHSLVQQSIDSKMRFDEEGNILNINADGFGIGWYSERSEPGLFKDKDPAWSNENLHELCKHVRARIFFAHIRASTTGVAQRSNCHPFKYKNWLFQHNGYVAEFPKIRRDLQMDIAPELYPHLAGTTDSETFFLLALTYGLKDNPKKALQTMIERILRALKENGVEEKLNLSCAISDGCTLYTLRYAKGEVANTLFYSSRSGWLSELEDVEQGIPGTEDNIIVVSEPLDQMNDKWTEIPENSFTTIRDNKVSVETCMD